MADTKITSLQPPQAGYSVVPATDVLPIVVIADPGMATSGSTRKVTVNQLLGAGGTATLASATITGALTVDTTTLVVNPSGYADRVGIGTATPGYDLEIAGTVRSSLAIRGNFAGGTDIAHLRFVNANGSVVGDIFSQNTNGGASDSAYLSFNTTSSGTSAERYRIGSDGTSTWSVGGSTAMTLNSTGLAIGDSPSYKLHVTASSRAAGANYSTSAMDASAVAYVRGAENDLSKASTILLTQFNGSAAISAGYTATYRSFLAFGVNNGSASVVESMRLDYLGNLGIGVTPSAWNASYKGLVVGGSGGNGVTIAGNDASIGTGYYLSGVGTYARDNASATASSINMYNRAFVFRTAASGAVNSAITWTDSMTLDASGNLLVGVASNPNTARAYFRYDTLTTQPVINSASVVAASTSWSHFIGQSGNGSSITTSNIFIYGNGNIQNVNGVYGTISDLRLKENIADARNYLSDLLKLRVVKYSLKEDASAVANKLGFIAQEVEQVFPAMVDTDPNDGNKGIKTSVLIPMLVKAIQELTTRVQTLEAK